LLQAADPMQKIYFILLKTMIKLRFKCSSAIKQKQEFGIDLKTRIFRRFSYPNPI
jgi:hypothetical protein